jgi:hypothetical protein
MICAFQREKKQFENNSFHEDDSTVSAIPEKSFPYEQNRNSIVFMTLELLKYAKSQCKYDKNIVQKKILNFGAEIVSEFKPLSLVFEENNNFDRENLKLVDLVFDLLTEIYEDCRSLDSLRFECLKNMIGLCYARASASQLLHICSLLLRDPFLDRRMPSLLFEHLKDMGTPTNNYSDNNTLSISGKKFLKIETSKFL